MGHYDSFIQEDINSYKAGISASLDKLTFEELRTVHYLINNIKKLTAFLLLLKDLLKSV